MLSNREDVAIELRRNSGSECAGEEPCALIAQARFCEGPGTNGKESGDESEHVVAACSKASIKVHRQTTFSLPKVPVYSTAVPRGEIASAGRPGST